MGKYIIELDDATFAELTKYGEPLPVGNTFHDSILKAVANSKPYDDSGDLISRSELRKTFWQAGEDCQHECVIAMETAIATIDNAPTVETYTYKDIMRYVSATEKLVRDKIKRPQGEWVGDCNNPECDQCHSKPLEDFTESAGLDGGSYITTPMHFCPNCGAAMRKGGEEK